MSEPEMYVNGERVAPPANHIVILSSDMERSRVFLGERLYDAIPGNARHYRHHPIKLPEGARLDLKRDGRLVASFVERGGVAVDPVELLLDA